MNLDDCVGAMHVELQYSGGAQAVLSGVRVSRYQLVCERGCAFQTLYPQRPILSQPW